MHMTKVAVVGASGYAGAELIRIIHAHPHFELGVIAAGSNAGSTLAQVHPQFSSVPEIASKVFTDSTPQALAGHDLVFLALPHGQSAELIAQLQRKFESLILVLTFDSKTTKIGTPITGERTPELGLMAFQKYMARAKRFLAALASQTLVVTPLQLNLD